MNTIQKTREDLFREHDLYKAGLLGVPLHTRDIPTIKAWRAQRHGAGLPSGLTDFYEHHGLCQKCHGVGAEIWLLRGDEAIRRKCELCDGTGKSHNGAAS